MKYRVTLNGKHYEVEVERGEAILLDVSDVSAAPVTAPPAASSAPPPAAEAPAPAAAPVLAAGEPLGAPMPGTVVSVKVAAGQRVKKGEILLLLEAMKMENEVAAPRDTTVVQVVVKAGASVNTGDPLLVLS